MSYNPHRDPNLTSGELGIFEQYSPPLKGSSPSKSDYMHNTHAEIELESQRIEDQLNIGKEYDHITDFPNKWARLRCGHQMREPVDEFLGTMILLVFGTGVDCQVVLSGNAAVSSSQKGGYLSISFGWAIGVALGVWVSGGISGGHLNPAVTLVQAIFRGFPWKKVPIYILAQTFGAFTGSGLVYANYYRAIDLFEGGAGVRTVPGTASLFTTFAADYLSDAQCFFSEFLGTAILLIVVLAITDKRNGPPPDGLVPLALFLTILGEGACLGMQTAYRGQYWIYTPIVSAGHGLNQPRGQTDTLFQLGPIIGAIVGAIIYDAFVFTGSESIFNTPCRDVGVCHCHMMQTPAARRGEPVPPGMDKA
ncbi:membrane protein [Ceratobasidium theobromae]|uniref:Membrane protein n=1 Tax=Ceratobasidium theobromae TaxID=1582974 RepID=A0A5N5QN44_9AGAM|nr:membrane protein [Ceratobasidium theobromae]